jgi:hypothetical protein
MGRKSRRGKKKTKRKKKKGKEKTLRRKGDKIERIMY